MSNTTFDEAKALQSRHHVLDAHSDIPLMDVYPRRLRGESEVMKKLHLPRQAQGGVHSAIVTVQCDCFHLATQYAALRQTLEVIDSTYAEEVESGGRFVIAKSGTELEQAHRAGSFSVLMSLEGGKAIEGSLEVLRCLHRLGVRCFGLTHNVPNQLGHGAGVRENYGLTEFGRSVVEELSSLRMILDLAHSSEKSFYDAIEVTSSTPIVSHTGCSSICPFDSGKVPWRNMSDKQLQTVADRGGVIGIAVLKPFVTRESKSTVSDVVKHIEHLVELVGINHVGIGADYIEYSRSEDQAYLGELFPLGSELYVEDLEDVTKLPNLTAALMSKGYSEGEISKILGENFLRVFKKVLG